MPIKDALVPEFDHEMATTRRLLERVPEAEFAWKPHDKSMSLGELAGHIANLPRWCSITLESTTFDLDTFADARPRQPESRAAVVREFDEKVRAARALLVAQSDPELLTPWTLKTGGQEIFTMPRISAIRSFVMNHLIHHRGQLSVYLRLKNVPIPPIYGPTADEQWG
jgi:uncharacterized damage-inducible protein DinB